MGCDVVQSVELHKRFGETYCFHLQGERANEVSNTAKSRQESELSRRAITEVNSLPNIKHCLCNCIEGLRKTRKCLNKYNRYPCLDSSLATSE
jgi:hypothetical protein